MTFPMRSDEWESWPDQELSASWLDVEAATATVVSKLTLATPLCMAMAYTAPVGASAFKKNGAASPVTSSENPPEASGVVVRTTGGVAESRSETDATAESADATPVTAAVVDDDPGVLPEPLQPSPTRPATTDSTHAFVAVLIFTLLSWDWVDDVPGFTVTCSWDTDALSHKTLQGGKERCVR